MWRRGGASPSASIPPTAVLLLQLFLAPVRGLRGRVLSLVSVYAPVSGARFDNERRIMFYSLSVILGSLPLRSVWVVGGDGQFGDWVPRGRRGIHDMARHAHGRRTRYGHQLVEWVQGEDLRFLSSFTRQRCRDTWFPP